MIGYKILGIALLLAGISTLADAEPHKAKCEVKNDPITFIDYHTKKTHDVDNWIVYCTAKNSDGKVLKEEKLPLAQPTEFFDAVTAAHKWVKENGN